jgi:uncharacterized protein involved in copper resistance
MNQKKLFVASVVTALFAVTSLSFAAEKGANTSRHSSDEECPMMKMMDMKNMKRMENMEGMMDKKGMQGMMKECPMMKSQIDESSQKQSNTPSAGKTREQVMQELQEHQERMRNDRSYAQEWRSMYESK